MKQNNKKLKKYSVNIDYPAEIMDVEAYTKEEAEQKALELLGDVTFNAECDCTCEASEIEDE